MLAFHFHGERGNRSLKSQTSKGVTLPKLVGGRGHDWRRCRRSRRRAKREVIARKCGVRRAGVDNDRLNRVAARGQSRKREAEAEGRGAALFVVLRWRDHRRVGQAL